MRSIAPRVSRCRLGILRSRLPRRVPRHLRRAVFELNLENRAANLLTVEVLCWEDIEDLLDEYPDLLSEFESSPKRQALSKPNTAIRLEPRWKYPVAAPANDEAGRDLQEASTLIDQRQYQLGRLKLMQLRERGWEQLERRSASGGSLEPRARVAQGRRNPQGRDAVYCGALDAA